MGGVKLRDCRYFCVLPKGFGCYGGGVYVVCRLESAAALLSRDSGRQVVPMMKLISLGSKEKFYNQEAEHARPVIMIMYTVV